MADSRALNERILMRAVSRLVVRWRFADERDTLLGLIADALRDIQRVGWIVPIARAADGLLAAKGPLEWSAATSRAADALDDLWRSDLVAAIVALSAEKKAMPA